MLNRMYHTNSSKPQLIDKHLAMGIEEVSHEDRKSLKLLDTRIKMEDGHYQVPLAFMKQDVNFPDNKDQVMKRLKHLERKFTKNLLLHKHYINFIKDMIKKGCVKESD